MESRRPVEQILKDIKRRMEKRKLGSVALSDLIEATDGCKKVGRGKIDRLFYPGINRSVYVDTIDDTLESILTVFGITIEDVFDSILGRAKKDLSEEEMEIHEFVNNPEAIPYIKIAMKQYKIKKAQEEIERLQKEMK
jgi:hypothetical protein